MPGTIAGVLDAVSILGGQISSPERQVWGGRAAHHGFRSRGRPSSTVQSDAIEVAAPFARRLT